MPRSAYIAAKVEPELAEAIRLLAQANSRTVSSELRQAILDRVTDAGASAPYAVRTIITLHRA